MSALDLSKLSIEELKKIDKQENKLFKKDVEQYRNREKQKLVDKILRRRQQHKKIKKVLDKTEKPKHTTETKIKSVSKSKPKKTKSFDEYFQECIKNKSIPKDTPKYVKKALERAIKEYE